MDENKISEFLNHPKIDPRTKIETFLSPYLDNRKCGQLTIPSDFTDSLELGKLIDDQVQQQITNLQQIRDPNVRSVGVQAIHKMLENKFSEIVEDSESYKIHMDWADYFKLKSTQSKVRPTLHEVYYYKNRDTREEIQKVIKERVKIRRQVSNDPEARKDKIKYAFPEEFDIKWLTRVGSLLEYPDCCVKHYAKGRENGVKVETRATQQLLDALMEGEVDTHVYYIGNFLPHSPSCPKAMKLGYLWEEKITEFNEELGKMYSQMLVRNAELILRQPEIVSVYLSQIKMNKKSI